MCQGDFWLRQCESMPLLRRAQDQVAPDSTDRDPMERLKALQEVRAYPAARP